MINTKEDSLKPSAEKKKIKKIWKLQTSNFKIAEAKDIV
jgi:hypothetical protein